MTAATLQPVVDHAFDLDDSDASPFNLQAVVVHNISPESLAFRSRLPLNICTQYKIQCDDQTVHLRASRLRITSCRRAVDGTYDIAAALCLAA